MEHRIWPIKLTYPKLHWEAIALLAGALMDKVRKGKMPFRVRLSGFGCRRGHALPHIVRCPSAQLLDVAWLPIDSDCPRVEVLWGAAPENCSNVDLVLPIGHSCLPVLQTHQTRR